MTIWYIFCLMGTVFLVLGSCTKKNLATLYIRGIYMKQQILVSHCDVPKLEVILSVQWLSRDVARHGAT
jgi:hypothetical protein